MTTIKVENLSKTYTLKDKVLHAVRGLSFEVSAGEGFGIIGHNGAGKTTVLKILAGHIKPTGGTVKYNGGISSLLDLGWSMHPHLSGYENIVLGAGLIGISASEARLKTPEIIAFSELDDSVLDRPLYTFSNGMYLKLAFAIMMSWPKKILLFDEVLAVGDASFSIKMTAKLMQLKQSGHCLILVSHNLEHIYRYCDRVIILQNGKSTFEGEPTLAVRKYHDLNSRKHVAAADALGEIVLKSLTVIGTNIGSGNLEVFHAGSEIKIAISIELDNRNVRHDLGFMLEDMQGNKLFGDDTLDWPEHAVSGACELEWVIPPNILNRGNFAVQVILSAGRRVTGNVGVVYFQTESAEPHRLDLKIDSAFYIKGALRPRNGEAFPLAENPAKLIT